MKAIQKPIPIPTEHDAMMAQTLGRFYQIAWNPGGTVAEKFIDTAKLQQLMLHLLSAPEELLPSC